MDYTHAVKLDESTIKELDRLKVHENQPYGEVIDKAVTILRIVREMRPMVVTTLDDEKLGEKLSKVQKEQLQALVEKAF